ncbi:MAG: tetratricopeptide repeat protein [Candidatus Zixiibacteriota bacterium]
MSKCTDKALGQLIHPYELDLLPEDQRQNFEIHLYHCNYCFENVKQFKDTSRLLNEDAELRIIVEKAVKETKTKPIHSGFFRRFMPASAVILALLIILIVKPWKIEISPTNESIAGENRIAIVYFEDLRKNAPFAESCEIISSLLSTDLSESRLVEVVSTQRIFDILTSLNNDDFCAINQTVAREVAIIAQANWMITGEVSEKHDSIVINSYLYNIPGDTVTASQKVSGPIREGVFPLVDRLKIAITNDLSLPDGVIDRRDRPIAEVTTHSEEAYGYYMAGIEQYAKYYIDDAVENFSKAIEYDSTFAMAYYYLALLYDHSQIDKALLYSPDAIEKEQLYIQSLYAAYHNDIPNQKQTLLKLVDKFPLEKEVHYRLAMLYSDNGELQSAINHAKQAIEIDSNYRQAFNLLTYIYLMMGDLKNALENNDQYLRIAPLEANPYDTRGDIFNILGQLDSAIAAYQNALDRKPDFYTSLLKLGYSYTHNGQYENANRTFHKLKNVQDDRYFAERSLGEAYILMRQGNFNKAIQIMETAVDHCINEKGGNPEGGNFLSFYVVEALSYSILRNYEKAVAAMDTAVLIQTRTSSESNKGLNFLYVYILAEAGQLERASEIAQDIADPASTGVKAGDYYYSMGAIEYFKEHYNTAVEYLEKCTDTMKEYYSQYLFGKANWKAGNFEKSIEIFESLNDKYCEERLYYGTWNISTRYFLGRAYEELGNIDEAVNQYSYFLNKWGNSASTLPEIIDTQNRLNALKARL